MKKSLMNTVQQNRQLFWDIDEHDLGELDEDAIVERLMAYGTMDNIRELETALTPKNLCTVYKRIRNKKRPNLKPETINFFDIYLSKYES